MLRGPNKLVIALLPAIAAFIVAIVVKDFNQQSGQLWFWVIVGLLVIGGIISARFIIGGLLGHLHSIAKLLLFLVIVAAYVVTFFFTGCLIAFNTGLL